MINGWRGDYSDLTIGSPQPVPTTAYRVNGICRTCNRVLPGTALTEAGAVQALKKHYRAHVKAGHRRSPGEGEWLALSPDDEGEGYEQAGASLP